MEFSKFRQLLRNQVELMFNSNSFLFITNTDNETITDIYLDSFPPGTNEIFRERREFDCSCCKQFIRQFGNVVAIKDNKLISIWDFEIENCKFTSVIKALSEYVKSNAIESIFITDDLCFGVNHNFEEMGNNVVQKWEHFFIKTDPKFINRTTDTIRTVQSEYNGIKDVFKRSLEEINEDSIKIVLDLISQNSLYRGKEWENVLKKFLSIHKEYHTLPEKDRENYLWEQTVLNGPVIGKIKNHSIGVLLTNLTDKMDVNIAVTKYESIVAPANYKRPKAIFTKAMVEQAKATIEKAGYLDSLKRRHATINDININNILYSNKDILKEDLDIFSELKKDSINKNNFKKIKKIHINEFIADVLPRLTNVEILFENRHKNNLMSLIAPQDISSKNMFKWDNPYSWSYNGNVTDSIKKNVKKAGGNVGGVLRFSIQWNDDSKNLCDLDAHCIEPDRNPIFFQNKGITHKSTGILDVDIMEPGNNVAVENITWSNINKMQEGEYLFYVHNYTKRTDEGGFKAEIEFDGKIYSYEYNKTLKQDEKIVVMKMNFSKQNGLKIRGGLSSTSTNKTIWNIQTNDFIPVSLIMNSPNYWDEQKGSGNKHYFFIIKDCLNDGDPNGFYNEFLKEDLLKHKRVFEALGEKMKVNKSENQLSGLGFSETKEKTLICKLSGDIKRVIELQF